MLLLLVHVEGIVIPIEEGLSGIIQLLEQGMFHLIQYVETYEYIGIIRQGFGIQFLHHFPIHHAFVGDALCLQDVSEILKREELNGTPVSMSMDCLSGETLGKSLPYMAEGGYWVVISTLAGTETNVMLRPLLTKGLHLVGSMLRKRTSEEKAQLLAELVEKVWPKIENDEMKPSIYKVLPLEEANEALDILERGENIGKVVLRVCDE